MKYNLIWKIRFYLRHKFWPDAGIIAREKYIDSLTPPARTVKSS